MQPVDEIVLRAIVIFGKLAGLTGVVLGGLLIFSAGKVRAIELRMGAGLTTQPIVDKLNEYNGGLDAVILRHPLIFGFAGLVASVQLGYVGTLLLLN